MRTVDLLTAEVLQDLEYSGEFQTSWRFSTDTNKWEKIDDYDYEMDDIPAPRLDDVAYWIREKYNFEVWAEPYFGKPMKYTAFVSLSHPDFDNAEVSYFKQSGYETFEDAIEMAIKKTIEILKTSI